MKAPPLPNLEEPPAIPLAYAGHALKRSPTSLGRIAFLFGAAGAFFTGTMVAIILFHGSLSGMYIFLAIVLVIAASLLSSTAVVLGTLSIILYGPRTRSGICGLVLGLSIMVLGFVMLPFATRF